MFYFGREQREFVRQQILAILKTFTLKDTLFTLKSRQVCTIYSFIISYLNKVFTV